MPNAITLFKKYIDNLYEVYKLASKTSVLDGDSSLAQAGANTNEIVIPKMTMDGLADYSRNGGYVTGNVNLTNETVKFNYDRGRKFNVDRMDNEETAGVAFGKLASEFIRTQVVPELDAFRFATYAAVSGINKESGSLTTGSGVLDAIATGLNAMDEEEVPSDQRYLFITPTLHRLIDTLDTYKSKDVLTGFAGIVDMPQSRFVTAIDMKDGTTTGEESGGFAKATGAKDINFFILYKPALLQYSKHIVNKVIDPDTNQEADAWAFFYRAYGLVDVYENKVKGLYLHNKA